MWPTWLTSVPLFSESLPGDGTTVAVLVEFVCEPGLPSLKQVNVSHSHLSSTYNVAIQPPSNVIFSNTDFNLITVFTK